MRVVGDLRIGVQCPVSAMSDLWTRIVCPRWWTRIVCPRWWTRIVCLQWWTRVVCPCCRIVPLVPAMSDLMVVKGLILRRVSRKFEEG
jgi:hypothetical protein